MLEARNVSYSYGQTPVLANVSLTVQPGEYVAILGANGAGKSTLVHMFNGSLAPSSGRVILDEEECSPFKLAQKVGLVRQDPRSQIVSASLTDEISFGPRNLGLPFEEIQKRVSEALSLCGLDDLTAHGTTELSGGQQQRLALAGVLAMHPAYLILDEALSQLDSHSRKEISGIIRLLVKEGVGVISITHRFEELQDVDRVLVLSHGQIAWEGSVQSLIAHPQWLKQAGITCDGLDKALPLLNRITADVQSLWDVNCLAGEIVAHNCSRDILSSLPYPPAEPYCQDFKDTDGLQALQIRASYGKNVALDNVSANFLPGSISVIGGVSGSGKTTLARILAGVVKPDSGEVRLKGCVVQPATVGLAFQRPEDQLFCDTVLDDVAFGPRSLGKPEKTALACARKACEQLGIAEALFTHHPLALSGGQRRMVALAGLVALDADAYVLDEPTAGLDAEAAAHLKELVCKLARDGKSVVIISHDLGEWLALAQHVYLLQEGQVRWMGTTGAAVEDPTVFEQVSLATPTWVALRHRVRECEQ